MEKIMKYQTLIGIMDDIDDLLWDAILERNYCEAERLLELSRNVWQAGYTCKRELGRSR